MIGKLTKQEIEELLEDNVFGHLGCNDGYNCYVYPSNYIYDGKHIICHSQNGFKNDVMRTNKRVCFQVDVIKDDYNWKSVMVHGEYEEIHDYSMVKKLINAFYDRRLFIKPTRMKCRHMERMQASSKRHEPYTPRQLFIEFSIDEQNKPGVLNNS